MHPTTAATKTLSRVAHYRGRPARTYTSRANLGQRPVINVTPVFSRITSEDLPLLQLLQSKFTFEDPKFKYLKKARGNALRWVFAHCEDSAHWRCCLGWAS